MDRTKSSPKPVLQVAEDRLSRRAEFTSAVQEGLAELEAGKLIDDEDVGKALDARYGAPRRRK